MTRAQIRTLYEYNDSANDSLLVMLTRAFGEETDLRASDDPHVRSIQAITTHSVAALAVWRSRWEGFSPSAMLDPAEYPTPLALRMAFGAERARFWGFFETIRSDADLDKIIQSTSMRGEPRIFPLWQMMLHALNHTSYHRGQITALLFDLGHADAVPDTDLILYLLEKQNRQNEQN